MTRTLATLTPSPARRVFATAVLAASGALLVWMAFAGALAAPVWRIYLCLLGAAAFLVGWRLWRATSVSLHLTEQGLRDSDGRWICRTDEIAGVERGMFAFKPSNGFLLRLKRPAPRGWAPGLWWRFGRRVGVGGATPAAPARVMADLLTALLQERAGR